MVSSSYKLILQISVTIWFIKKPKLVNYNINLPLKSADLTQTPLSIYTFSSTSLPAFLFFFPHTQHALLPHVLTHDNLQQRTASGTTRPHAAPYHIPAAYAAPWILSARTLSQQSCWHTHFVSEPTCSVLLCIKRGIVAS